MTCGQYYYVTFSNIWNNSGPITLHCETPLLTSMKLLRIHETETLITRPIRKSAVQIINKLQIPNNLNLWDDVDNWYIRYNTWSLGFILNIFCCMFLWLLLNQTEFSLIHNQKKIFSPIILFLILKKIKFWWSDCTKAILIVQKRYITMKR